MAHSLSSKKRVRQNATHNARNRWRLREMREAIKKFRDRITSGSAEEAAAEIGKVVGAPVLTVRTRLFYARREVYAAMAKDPALDAIAQALQLAAAEGATP